MGNCLRHENGLAGKEKEDLEAEPPHVKLWEEESEGSRERESKVVRIKVKVTKEELRQILGHKKEGFNSVEHLVHVLKHRAYEEEEDIEEDEIWRPTLETIPESHC